MSFRQACMNRFEACGIVGCELTILWRTADEYQQDSASFRPGWRAFGGDSSVGVRRASVRLAHPRFAVGAAVKMARSYGICRTARALRVNYYALKKRVEQASAAAPGLPEGGTVATFLELAPPDLPGVANALGSWKTLAGRRCGSI